MPFVWVTRLRLRSRRSLIPFGWRSLLSILQARRSPGNLHVSTLADANLAFWTRTVWESESAMRAFMMSGAHKAAMPKLLDWCDEAAVAHWVQDSDAPPSWPEAHKRLVTEGRRSKVRHPSPMQEAFQIPEPRS
jgi:hypothetical protein